MSLAPPTAVGGWTVVYEQMKRADGVPFITKQIASGFSAQSGITVVNSGQGVFAIQLFQSEMSGRNPGAFFYRVRRTDSGSLTPVSEGYRAYVP